MTLQEKIALYGGTVGKGAMGPPKVTIHEGPYKGNATNITPYKQRAAAAVSQAAKKVKGMSGKAKLVAGAAAIAATALALKKDKKQEKKASKATIVFEKLAAGKYEKKYRTRGGHAGLGYTAVSMFANAESLAKLGPAVVPAAVIGGAINLGIGRFIGGRLGRRKDRKIAVDKLIEKNK